jgi:hypothetical protein
MNIKSLVAAAAVIILSLAVLPAGASAATRQTSSGQVVHSRRLPVILHRAVPPQYGKHVYEGRR